MISTTISIQNRYTTEPIPGNQIQTQNLRKEKLDQKQKTFPTVPSFFQTSIFQCYIILKHHPFLLLFFNPTPHLSYLICFSTSTNQMGCCISKCRPVNNKPPLEHHHHHHQFNHVQDKLVISQAPPQPSLLPSPPPIIPHRSSSKFKISPSPPSPTSSSTSSVSSFTCTTANSNTISSASSLSSASSATLKDRSFSNEFLWSCYKDNPHIIRINSLREATLPLTNTRSKPSPPKAGFAPPTVVLKQHSPTAPKAVVGGSFSTMPQKRVRSNSPTNLTRQKSFRKEQPERPARIMLGSPSPSRRFSNGGGDKFGTALAATTMIMDTSVSKLMNSSPKVSAVHSRSVNSSSLRKEGVNKAASPNNSSLGRLQYSGLRHRETRTLRVGSKIDESAVKDVLSNHDMDIDLTEDIANPLISLDCFIFL